MLFERNVVLPSTEREGPTAQNEFVRTSSCTYYIYIYIYIYIFPTNSRVLPALFLKNNLFGQITNGVLCFA